MLHVRSLEKRYSEVPIRPKASLNIQKNQRIASAPLMSVRVAVLRLLKECVAFLRVLLARLCAKKHQKHGRLNVKRLRHFL